MAPSVSYSITVSITVSITGRLEVASRGHEIGPHCDPAA